MGQNTSKTDRDIVFYAAFRDFVEINYLLKKVLELESSARYQ